MQSYVIKIDRLCKESIYSYSWGELVVWIQGKVKDRNVAIDIATMVGTIPKFVRCNMIDCDEKYPFAWRNGYVVPKEYRDALCINRVLCVLSLDPFVCKRCKYGKQMYVYIHEAECGELVIVKNKSGYLKEWNLSDLE